MCDAGPGGRHQYPGREDGRDVRARWHIGARPPPSNRIIADAWASRSCWPSKPNANGDVDVPPTQRPLSAPALGLVVVFHSLKLIYALGRRLPGACGFVLTSVTPEQLDDHPGRQRVLPVSDKEPGGRLVHTALDEPRVDLVV
jgi:hypothetical protein